MTFNDTLNPLIDCYAHEHKQVWVFMIDISYCGVASIIQMFRNTMDNSVETKVANSSYRINRLTKSPVLKTTKHLRK